MPSGHVHHWSELRRQIPWRDEDFDPNRLAPERARYEDGTPHSDKDHAAKVAKPKPEVVFYCEGCTSTKAFEIPAARYKTLVEQLKSGELTDAREGPARPNDVMLVPLVVLVPEAVDELTDPSEAMPRSAFLDTEQGVLPQIGLVGKAAEEADAKLREAWGLPPIDYVHATHPLDRGKS